MRYVVGFAFDNGKVLLIKKLKPKWQAGCLNGIGGKVEDSESAHHAIAREFYEEVGVNTSWTRWRRFCTLVARDGIICFFSMDIGDEVVRQTEAEEPIWVDYNNLPSNVVDNLRWLIPMALAEVPVYGSLVEGEL